MPWRMRDEHIMVTLAPTMSSLTTSSAPCTPPVAARPAFKRPYRIPQMIDAVAHERRAHHGDVGSNHEQFDYVFGAVHSASGRQTGLQTAVQNSDPGERQA